jgi:hypothetical protein
MKDHFTLCLWFDYQAEEAAEFYTSIFKNSKMESISRYGKEGFEIHGQKEGTAMTANFTINGQSFTALNGGPLFKFNEAISLQRRRLIITGINFLREVRKDSADGSRISSAFHGRLSRRYFLN